MVSIKREREFITIDQINNERWDERQSLGGILISGPGVSSWAAGRLDVFVRGTDSIVDCIILCRFFANIYYSII
jgi:hypothetical protein